ncbi:MULTISPECIES: hypothetical protein [Microbacterium]|uniref:hypothetical protein n=1 Tax=Microbacterium TaxID=33882 RepID=UPI0027D914D1|nr:MULTISPECIES: hypothetical protein [Microbacterium]
MRSALLCAVFADADERIIDGEVEFPRMGAVGVLSVLPSDVDKKVIEGAWLDVGWFHSTTTMAESIAKVPGLVALPPKAHRLVQILLADDLVDEDPALLENLARFAHVLGVKPIIHRVVADRAGGVATDVLRTNPSELLVIGAGVHDAPVSAFTARYGGSNLHRSLADSGEDAFRWFAENLPRIVGVGPALIGLRALMADPARPPLPVRSPDLCRHHGSNVYVRDATSKIWWTRDFAQHGGSIFKTYLQIDGQLRWQADHDGDGKVITKKWKGSEGRTIHMRETTVCSNPAKHTS